MGLLRVTRAQAERVQFATINRALHEILGRQEAMASAIDGLSEAVQKNTDLINTVASDVADAKKYIQGLKDQLANGSPITDEALNVLQQKLADADGVLSGAADELTSVSQNGAANSTPAGSTGSDPTAPTDPGQGSAPEPGSPADVPAASPADAAPGEPGSADVPAEGGTPAL